MSARAPVEQDGMFAQAIHATLELRPIVALLVGLMILGGLITSPFDLTGDALPRDRVAVDALPDTGENQQIVLTTWQGRSPRDIEDQITYPLTTALLGLPGVQTVRSASMMGFSSVQVVFDDSVDFYWSRTRILEKISALPAGTLPPEVRPQLGPDATALGQVFWYTIEGRDADGKPAPGWDLHELREVQDWTVRPALASAPGVAEVSSIGGHVRELQVDVDPNTLRAYDLTIEQVARAVGGANRDIGARTLEINRVEHVIRGVGQITDLEDLRRSTIAAHKGHPVMVGDVATVRWGPALRRGALDVAGAEAVGGVVVARFGANPVEVIEGVRQKIEALRAGLPRRTLDDGRTSQLTIVPFYDRAEVVNETLDTLSAALWQQLLITALVVLLMLGQTRAAAVISSVMPLAVLATFGLMKLTGTTANVMSLAGVAIAIGTMVDMGIVFTEHITTQLQAADDTTPDARLRTIARAAGEVAPAVLTSTLTTVLSFLPVFGLTAAEGKLFRPLATTKTFALVASLGLAMLVLPTLASWLLTTPLSPPAAPESTPRWRRALSQLLTLVHLPDVALLLLAIAAVTQGWHLLAALILTELLVEGVRRAWSHRRAIVLAARAVEVIMAVGLSSWLLASAWQPLGGGATLSAQWLAVLAAVLGLMLTLWMFTMCYDALLTSALEHKLVSALLPLLLLALGLTAWRGADATLGWLPASVRAAPLYKKIEASAPGMGSEFMPPFDEGTFLYMPTTTPHASLGAALEQLRLMDALITQQVPEVSSVVGKLGRVDSALDPAPVSMFETVIAYKPEWRTEPDGRRVRQWRDHIKTPDDIWQAITEAAQLPGTTTAPKLMPIQTRQVMLSSGMRAPMGVKVRGPSLLAIEQGAQAIEAALREIPELRAETVFAERVVGKPYLEIHLQREAMARYGLSIDAVQRALEVGLGGQTLTRQIDGRARRDVRVRYTRGARDTPEAIGELLLTAANGQPVRLVEVVELKAVRGPQVIKSEDTFLTAVVTFDRQRHLSDAQAVEAARDALDKKHRDGALKLPEGVTYAFAGTYTQQIRADARLRLLIPLALALIFIVLFMQFRRTSTTLFIFSGVAIACSGGMALVWAVGQPWFLDVTVGGHHLRELLHLGPMNLSVAVWVGFIALVGIATDDGVVMATYLHQRFSAHQPTTRQEIRALVREASLQRLRPCLMTTATTILALLPVLTATGRGADVMRPMAIPVLGGMTVELVTLFVVPGLWAAREEFLLYISLKDPIRPPDDADADATTG